MNNAAFSKLDLFGTPVVINFSGEEKLKTRFGLYCTLLFFCCTILILYNGSQEMISHTNPSWVTGNTFNNDPREMNLTAANFPFAFGMEGPTAMNYAYMNDQIFTINVTYDTVYTTTLPNGTTVRNSTSIPITLETCTSGHFGDFASVFSNLNLSLYLCIASDQPYLQELRLQGGFTSTIYKFFTAEVYQCNSATSVCANDTEIQKYLEGAYFVMVYANMVIDPSNYDHPDARYQDVYTSTLSKSLYQTTTIDLAHLTVATDNGWVTQRIDSEEYVMVGKTIQNSQSRNSTDISAPLISCYYEVSKLETTYTRSYKKLVTILAEVGSLANSFLVGMVVFVSPYLKLRLRETLMNRLFDIDTTMDKKSRIQRQTVARERAERQRYMMNRSHMIIAKQRILNKYKYDGDVTLTPQHNNTTNDEKLLKGFGTSPVEAIKKERLRKNVLESGEENNLLARRLSHSRSGLRASSSPPGPSIFKVSSPVNKQHDTSSPSLSPSPKKVDENEFNKTYESEFQIAAPILAHINEAHRKIHPRISTLFADKEEPSKLEMKILEDPMDENLEQNQDQEQEQEQEQAENTPDRTFDISIGKEKNKSNEDKHKKENNEDQSPNITLKIQNFDEIEKEDDQHMHTEEEDKTLIDNLKKKTSSSVNLSFGEYFLSFFYKTKSLKRKLQILNAGRENIGDRLDVVNILKKLREVDKIRALLFDKDQLLLFNNLPKPEISLNDGKKGSDQKKSFSYYVLKDTNIKGEQGTKEQLLEAYRKLKYKENKTELDVRLLSVFDEALY